MKTYCCAVVLVTSICRSVANGLSLDVTGFIAKTSVVFGASRLDGFMVEIFSAWRFESFEGLGLYVYRSWGCMGALCSKTLGQAPLRACLSCFLHKFIHSGGPSL